MELSADTQDMLRAVDDLRLLPSGLVEMIDLAKKKGLSPKNRAELIYGIGRVVAVMREVADELEKVIKAFEVEEG